MPAVKQTVPMVQNTWIFVDFEERLARGQVKSCKLMNRDLVLWRSESGEITLMDAYCPHMGAHLGRGTVNKERLVCHFHKRGYGPDGTCGKKLKPVETYPIQTVQGFVFAWFGTSAPTWEMPKLLSGFPWAAESEWRIFRHHTLKMKFHPQDLLDNTVDPLHFKTFHNQCLSFQLPEILEQSEHTFKSIVRFSGHPKLHKLKVSYDIELETETFGPCALVVNGNIHILGQNHQMKFLFLCAPTEGENTNYTLALAVMKRKSGLARRVVELLLYNYSFVLQIWEFWVEGKRVWEEKTYLEEFDLQRSEEALQIYHDWYSKYYVPAASRADA